MKRLLISSYVINRRFHSHYRIKRIPLLFSHQLLKSLAHSIGFFACGIAKAAPVDEAIAQKYRRWLENGEDGVNGIYDKLLGETS